jgi:hypothetical protein
MGVGQLNWLAPETVRNALQILASAITHEVNVASYLLPARCDTLSYNVLDILGCVCLNSRKVFAKLLNCGAPLF